MAIGIRAASPVQEEEMTRELIAITVLKEIDLPVLIDTLGGYLREIDGGIDGQRADKANAETMEVLLTRVLGEDSEVRFDPSVGRLCICLNSKQLPELTIVARLIAGCCGRNAQISALDDVGHVWRYQLHRGFVSMQRGRVEFSGPARMLT